MDYQELVTAYKNDDLEISELKRIIDISKSLVGRPKYRAIDKVFDYIRLYTDIVNLCSENETFYNKEKFTKRCIDALNEEFLYIVNDIKSCKAWKYMKLDQKEYVKEKFDKLTINEKIKQVLLLQNKYLNFLEIQQIIDVKDCFKDSLSDDQIKKFKFLFEMFKLLKNEKVRNEFFCIDIEFIEAILKFKKTKFMKLDDYIYKKGKRIRAFYDENSDFFSINDYLDIIENINIACKTLKMDARNVIGIYSEISETEEEKKYLRDLIKMNKDVEDKVLIFSKLNKNNVTTSNKEIEKQKESVIKNKEYLEEITHKNIVIETNNREDTDKEEIKEKERVIPILFYWFGNNYKSLEETIGKNNIEKIFKKFEKIQKEKNSKVSLFLLTNARKDITRSRLEEIKRYVQKFNMKDIIEGAYGGYSSFKIEKSGKLKEISIMNRTTKMQILKLILSNSTIIKEDMLDNNVDDYIRFVIAKNDDNVDVEYLNKIIKNVTRIDLVKKQPLRFMPFDEEGIKGIDVLLVSQLKGIEQITQYFKNKYEFDGMMSISIADFDKFVNK